LVAGLPGARLPRGNSVSRAVGLPVGEAVHRVALRQLGHLVVDEVEGASGHAAALQPQHNLKGGAVLWQVRRREGGDDVAVC